MMQSTLLRRGTALACSLMLAVAITGCGNSQKDDSAQKIAALEQENAQLKAQIAGLQQQLSSRDSGGLESWTLDATGTSPDSPADIRFSAVPAAYTAGQTAELLVILEGNEAARAVCDWDGQRYCASVILSPADGYSFYCVLTGAAGAQEQILLSSPEDPAQPLVTYLASSLEPFVDVYIDSAEVSGSTLTVGYLSALVQPPMITPDGKPILPQSAELLWQHNGQVLERIPLTLTEGEAPGYYAATVSELKLTLPKLEKDDQLELQLHSILSDGSSLKADGASWLFREGALEMAVG